MAVAMNIIRRCGCLSNSQEYTSKLSGVFAKISATKKLNTFWWHLYNLSCSCQFSIGLLLLSSGNIFSKDAALPKRGKLRYLILSFNNVITWKSYLPQNESHIYATLLLLSFLYLIALELRQEQGIDNILKFKPVLETG